MRELTEAINAELSSLYGAENVYFGFARDASLPYQQFSQQPSSPSEYCTGQTGQQDNSGVRTTFPFLFKVFSDSDATSRNRIEEIVGRFEKHDIEMPSDKLLKTGALSQSVIEDPDQDDEGKTVYIGMAVIEFSISRG